TQKRSAGVILTAINQDMLVLELDGSRVVGSQRIEAALSRTENRRRGKPPYERFGLGLRGSEGHDQRSSHYEKQLEQQEIHAEHLHREAVVDSTALSEQMANRQLQ